MFKYIFLFLLATLAQADFYIKRVTSEQTGAGYMFAFQDGGVVRCWSMPDMLDINYVPPSWMKVPDAASTYSWPFAIGELATACQNGPVVPRTVGGPFYTISYQLKVVRLTDDNDAPIVIPSGIPCGDKIMWLNYFRAVSYNGQYGFAACT